MRLHALGPLREDLIGVLRRGANDLPGFGAPGVGRRDEEVGPATREDHGRVLPLEGVAKRGLRADYLRRVLAVLLLGGEHVTRPAARRDLLAAGPGVPGLLGPADGG